MSKGSLSGPLVKIVVCSRKLGTLSCVLTLSEKLPERGQLQGRPIWPVRGFSELDLLGKQAHWSMRSLA
jgi:hypothetical protein